MNMSNKEKVEDLRLQWKKLWQERVNDKVRAEGVATADYSDLFVEKGTVIHATRNFKTLSFKEILEQHRINNAERFITPDPQVGGWTKFIKTDMKKQKSQKHTRTESYHYEIKLERQQLKKGGRGWLHK